MKNLLIASVAALGLLASSNAFAKEVKTKSGHMSKAHTCVGADGSTVVATKEGKTIKRAKTCKKNGGTWKPVNADAAAATPAVAK